LQLQSEEQDLKAIQYERERHLRDREEDYTNNKVRPGDAGKRERRQASFEFDTTERLHKCRIADHRELSREQLTVARKRAKQAQLEERVRFALQDYREIDGRFDRIVSVGMFEHVGTPNYAAFFRKIRNLLTAEGIALIHSIGRINGPAITSAWTRKYIFPGGHIPALSEVAPVIERAGLIVTDVEILRLHYAETLRRWRERFVESHRQEGRLSDQRFCRMWEFYLASSELAFRYGGLMVFQAQLARQVDSVPLTRDYMYEREQDGARIGTMRRLTSVKREAQA